METRNTNIPLMSPVDTYGKVRVEMYIHSIDPVLFHLGPLEIRYYGIIFALGFLLAYGYLHFTRSRLGLSKLDVENLLLYLMVGVVIGSRLFHVLFWEPSFYLANPVKILFVWQGGLSFHGGLLGAVLAVWIFARKKKVPLIRLCDALTIPAAIGLAIGRLANFVNGEIWGIVADPQRIPWCVNFRNTGGDDVCRHPYQIYAFLKRAFVAGILVMIQFRKNRDGLLTWSFVFLFGVGRLVLDFWRDDPRFLWLAAGQWMSIVMVIVGGFMLIKNHWNDLKQVFSSST